MYKDALRAAWTEINLSNLDHNIKQIQSRIGPNTKIMGILKADAYGHGAVKVASVLRANGISSFGVASLSEAVRLRNAGFILEDLTVLGLTPTPLIDTIIEHRLIPVVCSYENAEAISNAAKKAGIIIKGYIGVDTGLGRIGFNPDDSTSIEDIKMIAGLSNFEIKGLLSSFATSDELDKKYSAVQEQRYMVFYKKLINADIKVPTRTIASSAAIMDLSSTHYDLVRPGNLLYGLYPSNEVNKSIMKLKPVMSVKANIVDLKKVPAGTSIGYGRNFTATRDSIIATIPLGYADGLSYNYTSKGKVIVNGVLAPIAGAIGMDMTMIDVTSVPYVRLSDEVTIMGSDGVVEITADDIASKLNTINYEVACDFGMRLPKVYTY